MNECSGKHLLIDRVAEGEATPEEAFDLGQHLPACTPCRIRLAKAHRLNEMVGELGEPVEVDEAFLQNAVTMTATAYREKDTIVVNEKITNDNTGHHIPTDSPLRQLILLVQVVSEQEQPLPLLDGAILPSYSYGLWRKPTVDSIIRTCISVVLLSSV